MEVEIAGVIFSVVVIDIADGMNMFRVQVAEEVQNAQSSYFWHYTYSNHPRLLLGFPGGLSAPLYRY